MLLLFFIHFKTSQDNLAQRVEFALSPKKYIQRFSNIMNKYPPYLKLARESQYSASI